VKQISFVESKSASYQDTPFIFEVLCKAKSIVIVPKPLLHWRSEGIGQQNSTSATGKRLFSIIDRFIESREILKKYYKYELLKEEYYTHALLSCYYSFCVNIQWKYKKEFFGRLREIFVDIQNDKSFRYKYFNEEQKKKIQDILNGNFWRSEFLSKIFTKRFLLSIHINRQGFIFQFLGLQISSGKYINRPAFLAIKIG
jgi:hypothetical protein